METVNIKQEPIPTRTDRSKCKEKTDRILIATIGANSYRKTSYIDKDGNVLSESGYAFDAVVKQENPNKLILVGTLRSWWNKIIEFYKNAQGFDKANDAGKLVALWDTKNEAYNYDVMKNREDVVPAIWESDNSRTTVDSTGMDPEGWAQIEEYIRGAGDFDKVRIVIVPNGITEDEQKAYFEQIRNGIEDMTKDENNSVEILFDISNGFRSIPLYDMMLVRYFSLLRPQKFSFKAYYGNLDVSSEYGFKSPLVNLSVIPLMTDWINALHDFLSHGSVKTLIQCLEKEKDQQIGEDANRNIAYIEDVISQFSMFEYGMNANNLFHLVQGIVFITGNNYTFTEGKGNKVLDLQHPCFSPQARLMLTNIHDNYKERFTTSSLDHMQTPEAYILEQIALLYTSHGNYGDAAIAFQEGVLTYVMERFYKYENVSLSKEYYDRFVHNYSEREDAKHAYNNEIKEDKYKSGVETDSNTDAENFAIRYLKIKDRIRNVQAHFKYDSMKETDEREMKEWLEKSIKDIVSEMESGCDESGNIEHDRTGLRQIYNKERKRIKDGLKDYILKVTDDKYEFKREEDIRTPNEHHRAVLAVMGIREYDLLAWRHKISIYQDISVLRSDYDRFFGQTGCEQGKMTGIDMSMKSTLFAWIKKKVDKGAEIDKVINGETLKAYANQLQQEPSVFDSLVKALQQGVIPELKDCVLAMYDIRGKQNYIYRSSHLKEIVGGSAIIRDCFKDYLYPAAETYVENGVNSFGILHAEKDAPQEDFTVDGLYKHLYQDNYLGEVVYEGGGNYLLIFKTEDIYKEVTYRFTKALMFGTKTLEKYGRKVSPEEEKPGTWSLKVLATCIGNLDFDDYEGDRTRLYSKHRINEASESNAIPSGTLPVVQVSYDTSMPLTYRRPDVKDSEEKITAESYAKYCKFKNEPDEEPNKVGEKILDNMITKKGEDSLLAVIYFDGNNMGAKVQEETSGLKTYKECVKALRKFSADIQKNYVDNPIIRIDTYLKKKYKSDNPNRRIVVGAGDEMTIICNAHDAYDIIRVYLKGLPEGNSSCAGAAIFHSHAPYNEAYRIAEECCENCKKYMRDNEIREACLMDFHYCRSGIGISLEKIREHEVGDCISKPWFVSKNAPDTEDGTSLIGHEEKRLIPRMAKFQNDIGRSNVKGLADYAKKGNVGLELEIGRIRAHMESEKREQTDFEFVKGLSPDIKRSLFYDVAIMYDLWFAK